VQPLDAKHLWSEAGTAALAARWEVLEPFAIHRSPTMPAGSLVSSALLHRPLVHTGLPKAVMLTAVPKRLRRQVSWMLWCLGIWADALYKVEEPSPALGDIGGRGDKHRDGCSNLRGHQALPG
jgi:hypothetical protein